MKVHNFCKVGSFKVRIPTSDKFLLSTSGSGGQDGPCQGHQFLETITPSNTEISFLGESTFQFKKIGSGANYLY